MFQFCAGTLQASHNGTGTAAAAAPRVAAVAAAVVPAVVAVVPAAVQNNQTASQAAVNVAATAPGSSSVKGTTPPPTPEDENCCNVTANSHLNKFIDKCVQKFPTRLKGKWNVAEVGGSVQKDAEGKETKTWHSLESFVFTMPDPTLDTGKSYHGVSVGNHASIRVNCMSQCCDRIVQLRT
jgi:hypothetical protein